MTIEITLLISIVSVSFAIFTGLASHQRNKKADDKADATELTTVIVKLDGISTGVAEIKSDMRNIRSDVQALHERVVVVEQSAKSLHKRVDMLEGKVDTNRDR